MYRVAAFLFGLTVHFITLALLCCGNRYGASAVGVNGGWVEGEMVVSNTIVQYEGFLGFGIWNVGILSTPEGTVYRDWIRCSAQTNEMFSTTFLIGRYSNGHRTSLDAEMFAHKDIIFFNISESYGFGMAKKVFGFFDAVTKHRPDTQFVVKTDHDIAIDNIEVLLEETARMEKPVYYCNMVWGLDNWPHIKVVRNTSSKHYVSASVYAKTHYPSFCSGWGYVIDTNTLRSISQIARSEVFFSSEDAWIGILAEKLGISPTKGNISLKGNVVLSPYEEDGVSCPLVVKSVCRFLMPKLNFVFCDNHRFDKTTFIDPLYTVEHDANLVATSKPAVSAHTPFKMQIVIMVKSEEPLNLFKLLRSLRRANYTRAVNLTLVFTFRNWDNEHLLGAQIKVANSFNWPFGGKILLSKRTPTISLTMAWRHSWLPESSNNFALFLTDNGAQISHDFFRWVVDNIEDAKDTSDFYGLSLWSNNTGSSGFKKWEGFLTNGRWWRKFLAYADGTIKSTNEPIHTLFSRFILLSEKNLRCTRPPTSLIFVREEHISAGSFNTLHRNDDFACSLQGEAWGRSSADINFVGFHSKADEHLVYASVENYVDVEHRIGIKYELNSGEINSIDLSRGDLNFVSHSTFTFSLQVTTGQMPYKITLSIQKKRSPAKVPNAMAQFKVFPLGDEKKSPTYVSVDIIIFTNSPTNLAALLASIDRHVSGHSTVHVLYNASTACGRAGFELVQKKHLAFNFIDQGHFGTDSAEKKFQFMEAVVETMSASHSTHVVPLVDECIFVRRVNVRRFALKLVQFDPLSTVQLRLGTHLQAYGELRKAYPDRFIQEQFNVPPLEVYDSYAGHHRICISRKKTLSNHFWSVTHFTGAIFSRTRLLDMWQKITFQSPSDLDSQWHAMKPFFPRYHMMPTQAVVLARNTAGNSQDCSNFLRNYSNGIYTNFDGSLETDPWVNSNEMLDL